MGSMGSNFNQVYKIILLKLYLLLFLKKHSNKLSEGIFEAANILSSLKVVYMFTINSHLGPLQISLGRAIFDILKSVFPKLNLFFK